MKCKLHGLGKGYVRYVQESGGFESIARLSAIERIELRPVQVDEKRFYRVSLFFSGQQEPVKLDLDESDTNDLLNTFRDRINFQ